MSFGSPKPWYGVCLLKHRLVFFTRLIDGELGRNHSRRDGIDPNPQSKPHFFGELWLANKARFTGAVRRIVERSTYRHNGINVNDTAMC